MDICKKQQLFAHLLSKFPYSLSDIETDISKRWEKGIPHHPKSVKLMDAVVILDFVFCNDYFCWKTGGDGDNGETLMYLMDIYFEAQDKSEKIGT